MRAISLPLEPLNGNFDMWHMGNDWWAGGFLMMVLLGLLILALVSFNRRPGEPSAQNPMTDRRSPMEILEVRYARGELSDEEFDRMRQRLRSGQADSEN